MQCPSCKHHVTLNDPDRDHAACTIERLFGGHLNYVATIGIYRCPNPACGEVSVRCNLKSGESILSRSHHSIIMQGEKRIHDMLIFPILDVEIKRIEEFVPENIRNDIYEAQKISKLSPKASATLIRRALQGMIRDFWKVKPGNLNMEIKEIKEKVDPLTWESIDAVRSIGNIGAHMEKDVNEIIDIDPGEADILIRLAYDLIQDWYVLRNDRERRKTDIIKIAQDKK